MVFGSCIFFLLFLFLLFICIASILAFFQKIEFKEWEPEVSVVIPCYNEEKNIISCLDAIYASDYTFKKIETIIVDDGSTDNTVKTIEENHHKYPDLRIIKSEHKGKTESLNIGIKNSSNEIVFTVDADTLVHKDTLKKLTRPFSDERTGATNGSCIVRNNKSILGMFQNVEYHYNNLIRRSLSTLFKNGIWFYGAFACYRKNVLEKIGYFKKDSMTEDADIALEIYAAGYKTINVHNAFGDVLAHSSLKGIVRQRTRWWIGVLQALKKNKKLFSRKSNPSILFLFVNQYWWSVYAVVSIPLLAYQFNYWISYNLGSFYMLFMYTFRWFSILGPIQVIYMIPKWGISIYSIFGVLSGLITTLLLISSLLMFKDKFSIRNLIGIFFYFPYTILLNTIIIISLVKVKFLKRMYFLN